MGIIDNCFDDALGVGHGAGVAGCGWSEDGVGDGVGGVGIGGVCLGGEVDIGCANPSENVHLGWADVGLVGHGLRADGEYSSDLAFVGAEGLPEFFFKDWDGSGVGGGGGDFGAAVADACIDEIY